MTLFLLASLAVAAPEARVAVIVSANNGVAGEVSLRYANQESDRLTETLIEVGGFAASDVFQVKHATPDTLTDGLGEATVRASDLRDQGYSVTAMVYYTGHAGLDGLHLSGEVLPLGELKTASRVIPADQRIFVIDACQSGQIFRSMGGRLVDVAPSPREFDPPDGEVWITSAGPEESAFEVDERRGALFTHFFVSGLRGAADANHDDGVTLGELYGFVSAQTSGAAASIGQLQQPRWGGEMEGWMASDVAPGTGLRVQGPVRQPLLVVRRDMERVVAELPAGGGGYLALPSGKYQLVAMGKEGPQVADIAVRDGQVSPFIPETGLARTRGVRTRGGLFETHPWRLSLGSRAFLGTTPLVGPLPGVDLGIERATGRGHTVRLSGFASRANRTDSGLASSESAIGSSIEWAMRARFMGVQLGGGAGVDLHRLQQRVARVPDEQLGTWYGTDTGEVSVVSGASVIRIGPRLRVPIDRIAIDLDLDAGARSRWAVASPIEPTAGGRLTVSLAL